MSTVDRTPSASERPPIARATLTIAALGALLVALELRVAQLVPVTDGFLWSARWEHPIGPLVHPLGYLTAGWLLGATLIWLVLRVSRRRTSWDEVAAALGCAAWPAAGGACVLLAIALAEGPATLGVTVFWIGVLASVRSVAREMARLPKVGVRGAVLTIGVLLVPLTIAAATVGRFWIHLHGELVTFGIVP